MKRFLEKNNQQQQATTSNNKQQQATTSNKQTNETDKTDKTTSNRGACKDLLFRFALGVGSKLGSQCAVGRHQNIRVCQLRTIHLATCISIIQCHLFFAVSAEIGENHTHHTTHTRTHTYIFVKNIFHITHTTHTTHAHAHTTQHNTHNTTQHNTQQKGEKTNKS